MAGLQFYMLFLTHFTKTEYRDAHVDGGISFPVVILFPAHKAGF